MSTIRAATNDDLNALLELEQQSFKSDQLSRRSFKRFIQNEQDALLVIGTPVVAYGLLLFHRGTSLARIYSLAVAEDQQGKGYARTLIESLETSALERDALFIRLEVANNNTRAYLLYQKLGYKVIATVPNYYADGGTATRMEKRLKRHPDRPSRLAFYAQNTEFTCGPASLLMAMHSLDRKVKMHLPEELQIWRESTTIYMTSGHGGCSAQGLAGAAARRGFKVELWVSRVESPFLSGVRNQHKKDIIQAIHNDDQYKLDALAVPQIAGAIHVGGIQTALADGYAVVLLISTYQLNRNKAPHWVWLVSIDDNYAYINDPYVDTDEYRIDDDQIYVPVPLAVFARMIGYGTVRYSAAVLIKQTSEND
ncbi:GNAT family N-acetyltransferase/peptidase C39 family protein [Teredinibacter waterburyi]|jgi:Acetyltransferases|uniref:GNAT family N-acetyltransferase/peptidase C39 family protein n=1 Tax=Teredinibacter waterburyi TaxID=1500538 RepID=UPI00165F5032|nr:GNAT family N-acetyltransferase/peptidase C39 family protein [Teredinibacter waterburyi]